MELLIKVFFCYWNNALFVAAAAAILFPLYKFGHTDDELFRKLLHFTAFGFCFLVVNSAESCAAALAALVIIAAGASAVFHFAQKLDSYSDFFKEREKGEVKRSVLLFVAVLTVLTAVCWGIFRKKHAVLAAVAVWGFGDAAAALIGKRFGRRHFSFRFADGHKTLAGTAAMTAAAFIACFVTLYLCSAVPRGHILGAALAAAPAAAITELCSKNGSDTVTVPLVSAAVLLLLT